MKYMKNPEIINVEEYKFGMEDGFIQHGEYVPADIKGYPEIMVSKIYPRYLATYDHIIEQATTDSDSWWKPYIVNKDMNKIVIKDNNDRIVTFEDGTRTVYDLAFIESNYTIIQDLIKD